MTFNAIPTTYQGVRFRSRLEARWSAFFDLVGWRWTYEPIDLAGYIPDFIVEHARYSDDRYDAEWLVASGGPNTIGCTETVRRIVEVKPSLDLVDLISYGKKIDESGWDGHASIVGSTLHEIDGGLALGVFRSSERTGDSMRDWGGSWMFSEWRLAQAAWIEAGNRIQWKRPPAPFRRFLAQDPDSDHGDH